MQVINGRLLPLKKAFILNAEIYMFDNKPQEVDCQHLDDDSSYQIHIGFLHQILCHAEIIIVELFSKQIVKVRSNLVD